MTSETAKEKHLRRKANVLLGIMLIVVFLVGFVAFHDASLFKTNANEFLRAIIGISLGLLIVIVIEARRQKS